MASWSLSPTFDTERPPHKDLWPSSYPESFFIDGSELVYDILQNASQPCSCQAPQHTFFCSKSSKQISLKTINSASDIPPTIISNISAIPQHLSARPSRAFENSPFHLTISSSSEQEVLTILCLQPETIITPESYHSFVMQQCFVNHDTLSSPRVLPLNHMTFISVVTDDFCSTPAVRKARKVVEESQDSGYQTIHNALSIFSNRWKPRKVPKIQKRNPLKSEKQPRRPRARTRTASKRRPKIPSEPSAFPSPVAATPLPRVILPPSRIPLPINPASPLQPANSDTSHKRGRIEINIPLRRTSKRQRIYTPSSPVPTPSPTSHSDLVPFNTAFPSAPPPYSVEDPPAAAPDPPAAASDPPAAASDTYVDGISHHMPTV